MKKINVIAIWLLCAWGNAGRIEGAKEATTQCPEIVRPKAITLQTFSSHNLIPDFLSLRCSCF